MHPSAVHHRSIALCAALSCLALLAFPAKASAWSGPAVSIVNKNGRQVLQICDQGGGCQQSTPFFLALNLEGPGFSWPTFLYQAQLQINTLSASSNGTVPILQVHFGITSDAALDEVVQKLNTLSIRPYLMVRKYLGNPPLAGLEAAKIMSVKGEVRDNTPATGHPWAFNETWLAYQESEITRILNRLDATYPGRVMGVYVLYENGGEWFYRSYGYNAATSSELEWPWSGNPAAPQICGTGADSGNVGGQVCNLVPWSNHAAALPGPVGRHFFYLNDYSSTTLAGFCSWAALPSPLLSGCRAATTVERNNAVPGQALPGLGRERGVFIDPSELNSLRAAYYNRFLSLQKVRAITRILAKAKQLTGNRIYTVAPYGYLYGLGHSLPASGHTELTSLIASSAIDSISGPYSYSAARGLGYSFAAQGVPDAPRLANKLWMDEDDSRTHLSFGPSCPDPGFRTVTTLWDSIRLLRRNLLTAGIHGHALYFLDLSGCGWFGDPARTADSEALWGNLLSVFGAVNKLQRSAPNRYEAQVAMFVDDLSPNYMAGLTPAAEYTYDFSLDLYSRLQEDVARLGTPVKHYLLSDLLKANLDLSAIKLAIFPNAFNARADVRAAIASKLKVPGKTLLFVYAAGYLQQDAAASVANIQALTGIGVALGSGAPALSQAFTLGGPQNGGPDYPLTPWFQVSDSGATALATYRFAGGVSMARKSIAVPGGSYTSIYAAAPKLPLSVIRKISEDAGVHHFTAVGDAVESSGNLVMVHANTSAYKTISFPAVMPRIFETALYPSDQAMCISCSQLASAPFNAGDTRAFRWTSRPFGNFELTRGTSSATIVEGWAADMDLPDQAINVAVYRGGPIGTGTPLGEHPTLLPRPDVNTAFGITGTHGYAVSIGACPTGTPIYMYAVDPELSSGDGNAFIGVNVCP